MEKIEIIFKDHGIACGNNAKRFFLQSEVIHILEKAIHEKRIINSKIFEDKKIYSYIIMDETKEKFEVCILSNPKTKDELTNIYTNRLRKISKKAHMEYLKHIKKYIKSIAITTGFVVPTLLAGLVLYDKANETEENIDFYNNNKDKFIPFKINQEIEEDSQKTLVFDNN